MAKISVSIPDDLLARAREASGDEEIKMSQLLQRGLECLLGPERPAYATRSDRSGSLLEIAAAAQIEKARKEYQFGYDRALVTAVDLPLRFLDYLSRTGHSVRQWAEKRRRDEWIEGLEDTLADGAWEEKLGNDLGAVLDETNDYHPPAAFLEGYEAAIRDLWATISSPPALNPARSGPTSATDSEE